VVLIRDFFVNNFALLNSKVIHASFRIKSRKSKFNRIYKSGGFGGENAPLSGIGSTIDNTSIIRNLLPNLIIKYDAKSIIDAPCGDFNWMKEVDLGNIHYIGVDIVDDVINNNLYKHSENNRSFIVCDIVKEILPAASIILSRDCFIHLSNSDIIKTISNFKSSGSRYLLTNTYVDLTMNNDMVTGRGFRPINLGLHPFNYPEPLFIQEEDQNDEGRSLALWILDDLPG